MVKLIGEVKTGQAARDFTFNFEYKLHTWTYGYYTHIQKHAHTTINRLIINELIKCEEKQRLFSGADISHQEQFSLVGVVVVGDFCQKNCEKRCDKLALNVYRMCIHV